MMMMQQLRDRVWMMTSQLWCDQTNMVSGNFAWDGTMLKGVQFEWCHIVIVTQRLFDLCCISKGFQFDRKCSHGLVLVVVIS